MPAAFSAACRRCPRLAAHLEGVRQAQPGYHAAPVPSFGERRARLLVVGLAPGMHGANRTGRPFTGDHAGILLYATLHEFGFASRPTSEHAGDGLRLHDCRITNAVRCLPPANRPQAAEIRNCNDYLAMELAPPVPQVVIALGRVAHEAVLRACAEPLRAHPFAHAAGHRLGAFLLLDSYHCSRYNTQTRRLTPAMFREVFALARRELDG